MFHVEHRRSATAPLERRFTWNVEGGRLPEGAFVGDAWASGPLFWWFGGEGEAGDCGALAGEDLGWGEVELGELGGGPAGAWVGVGGFADGEMAAGVEEPDGALGGDGGGAEASGDDEGEVGAELGIAGSVFGPGFDRSEAVGKIQVYERLAEEGGPAAPAVEEGPGRLGPGQGEHETGDATARPEVQHRAGGGIEQGGHALGMADVILDRAGAEETSPTRLLEDA
jgi:hypothetical protein